MSDVTPTQTAVKLTLPNSKIPITDGQGNMTLSWRLFFQSLVQALGGPTNSNANEFNELAAEVATAASDASEALTNSEEAIAASIAGQVALQLAAADTPRETSPMGFVFPIEAEPIPSCAPIILNEDAPHRPGFTVAELLGLSSLDGASGSSGSGSLAFEAGGSLVGNAATLNFASGTVTITDGVATYTPTAGSGGASITIEAGAPSSTTGYTQPALYFDNTTTPYTGYVLATGGVEAPSVDDTPQTATVGFSGTVSVTLPEVNEGDYVLVQISSSFNSGGVESCTATGLTFTKLAESDNPGGVGTNHAVYGALASATLGSTTITGVTAGGYGTGIAAFTVSGVDSASPLDPNSLNPATSLSGSATISTTESDDLVLYFYEEGSGSTGLSVPSGFTQLYTVNGSNNNVFLCGSLTAADPLTGETYTIGGGGGSGASSIIVALRPSSGTLEWEKFG